MNLQWSIIIIQLFINLTCAIESRLDRSQRLKLETISLFNHGYDSYKQFGFPSDEVLPISCKGIGRNDDRVQKSDNNDVFGNYYLTLIDSLDTFIIFNQTRRFQEELTLLTDNLHDFDINSRVQVFEVTIRVLGGLLSSHQLALHHSIPNYHNELLDLAFDLGKRLLPAFATKTGIPFARVHLRHGIFKNETIETCTAGAGSLLLEFTTLSKLTNQPVFEQVARKAFYAIWNSRSALDLVGNTITVQGLWQHTISSTGAGIDSFIEYALKSYVLLGEEEYWRVYEDITVAINRYLKSSEGFWYRGADMKTGNLATTIVDSLSAFYPGTLILAGDIESAIKAHLMFAFQWLRYSAIPETFDTNSKRAIALGYPLRPEFIESNLFLYQATQDPFYLDIAERILYDLKSRTKAKCGLAAIYNVETGQSEDKQPSFVTSETLKYLYLTFDETNQFNQLDENWVFSTEGHLFSFPPTPTKLKKTNKAVCESYDSSKDGHFLNRGIRNRDDFEYARFLVGYDIEDTEKEVREGRWSPSGYCSIPILESPFIVDLLFGTTESLTPAKQVYQDSKKIVHITEMTNLRFTLTKTSNGKQYYVSQVGPFSIESQTNGVVIEDAKALAQIESPKIKKIQLEFMVGNNKPFKVAGLVASFGPSFSFFEPKKTFSIGKEPLEFIIPKCIEGDESFDDGCKEYSSSDKVKGKVIIVTRGGCDFFQKSHNAFLAKARGIIVINTPGESDIIPSSLESLETSKELVPLVLVGQKVGKELIRLKNQFGKKGKVRVEELNGEGEMDILQLGGYQVTNVKIKR